MIVCIHYVAYMYSLIVSFLGILQYILSLNVVIYQLLREVFLLIENAPYYKYYHYDFLLLISNIYFKYPTKIYFFLQ